jgi:hypothetical protein
MAEKKEYQIKFENGLKGSFIDPGKIYTKDAQGNIIVTDVLKTPFEIKDGQTLTISKEIYQYLRDKGAVRTKAEQKERDRLRRKSMIKRSGRAEPRKDMQTFTEKERLLIFTDLPYEV